MLHFWALGHVSALTPQNAEPCQGEPQRYFRKSEQISNCGLARKQEAFAHGEKTPSAIDLHRELNALKKGGLSWMDEVSKCAPQEALRDLDKAFAHFFHRVKEKRAGRHVKAGFPRFKSRKKGPGGFRLSGAIHVFEKAIRLPRLRLKERGYLPTGGVPILSATVSEKAGCGCGSGHIPHGAGQGWHPL